ncbi:DUF1641 domain-containing protein [Geobacillus sp. FSL W8-0032]|uniref:DUF1641 domain-containing protein n=1 Tax=unclassified Geobacillus TaxID=2642459 RepID=UPI0030DABDF0
MRPALLQRNQRTSVFETCQPTEQPRLAGQASLINHLFSIAGLAASLDPEKTAKLLGQLAAGVMDAYEQTEAETKKIGLLDLLRALNDPDTNRAIRFGLSALKAIGQQLGSKE